MASSMAHQSDNTTNTRPTTHRHTLPPLQPTSTTSSSTSSLTLPSLFARRPAPTAPQYDLAHFASIFSTFSQKAAQDIHTEKMELGGNPTGGSYGGYGRQLDMPAYPSHYMPSDNSGRSGQFPPGHPMSSHYGGPSSNPGFPSVPGGSASHQQGPYPSVPAADLAALQMMWMQGMGSSRGHPQPGGETTQSSYQLTSQPNAQWSVPSMPGQPPLGGVMGNAWLPPNVPGSSVPPLPIPGAHQTYPSLGQPVSELQARQMLYMQWQQQQAAAGGNAAGGYGPSSPGDRSSGSDTHGADDGQDGSDDKRRRNTEASARFRAKKKERVQALSRKISDLESKATGLEREASDLKTENAWLKELVIMKGRRRLETQGAASAGSRAQQDGDSESEQE